MEGGEDKLNSYRHHLHILPLTVIVRTYFVSRFVLVRSLFEIKMNLMSFEHLQFKIVVCANKIKML